MFVTLAPTSIYTKSTCLYLLLLAYWDQHFPEVAKIWQQNLPAFIEEDGELSFSVLARTVLADTTKSSFDTLNNAYQGQQLYKEAMTDLEKDLDCFSRTASQHTVLLPEAKEVCRLKEFLEHHFNTLQTGTLEIYPKMAKGAAFYLGTTDNKKGQETIKLYLDSPEWEPAMDLAIREFEPPDLQQSMKDLLSTLDTTLNTSNFEGVVVKNILDPPEIMTWSCTSDSEDDSSVE